METLFLNKQDTFIEKALKPAKELMLLAKGDGVEIMFQNIQPEEIFVVSPGESEKLLEFFYIIEGSITCQKKENECILQQGDYFYVHNLKENVFFKTNNYVKMLYVSSQPIFHLLSSEIAKLTNIATAIESKDLYTYNHNKNLHEYAMKVAHKMNLSKESLEKLLYAALFHDLGKINTPDEILNKPGLLTIKEFEYIKRHPIDGKNLVEKTYLKNIGKIIEQHHERLDGSGYPWGLKSDEIVLEAKIIAVVDSFDAMISERPYHKAMTVEAAMDELKQLSDKLYDRKIVNILEEVLIEESKL
ncbi:MAG: metal dependent phosphohydrolase [Anaerocolumna sp.]|jgi:putative nucleotidyltransferase with HDIG domain|nr:metal dependent phosphohydrolase [Anaerocolumna sp.]